MVSATGRSTVVAVRFLIRWNLLQYIGSLWRCVTVRSRRRGLTPRSNRSGRSGYRRIWNSCSNLFMFHRGFCNSSGRVTLGGERIFLRLEVSIFGCWIKFQFLGAIKICKEKLIRETGKSHNVFTSVEISVKLGHSKGRGGGTGEREDEAPARERFTSHECLLILALFCPSQLSLCHLAFGRSIASFHSSLSIGAELGPHVGL
jgi:hypothetical protein